MTLNRHDGKSSGNKLCNVQDLSLRRIYKVYRGVLVSSEKELCTFCREHTCTDETHFSVTYFGHRMPVVTYETATYKTAF